MTIDIVADALAAADAEAQAQFLNNFARHLKMVCKNRRREETQLSYISDQLDENGRELVKQLSEFVVLSMETRAKAEQDISDLWNQKREIEREIEEMKNARPPEPEATNDF